MSRHTESWWWAGAAAVIRRDAAIFFSYRLRVVSQLVLALFSVTLFYYVSRLVGVRRFSTPDEYFAYVVVGLVVLHTLTATLAQVPNTIRTELVAGTFERVVTSPLGAAAGVAAMTVFPVVAAVGTGVATLAMAVAIFGLGLAGAQAFLAVPVAALAIFAFMPFSLLVAALVLISKQAGTIGNLVVIGLSLAGGVYYPPDLMPGWIRWITDVQPFTPALELLRHLLIDSPTQDAAWVDAIKLAGFGAVMTPVAFMTLDAAVSRCRRSGTLIEY